MTLTSGPLRICVAVFLFPFVFGLAIPIEPAYLLAEDSQLTGTYLLRAKRTESPGGLFGGNNIPDLADLDQTSIPDCGLISVLGALISLNSDWITSIISYSGEPWSTTPATFKLHRVDSLDVIYQTVEKASLTDVRSDALEGWWVGGIEQAIRQTGQNVTMLPSHALEMVTGSRATHYFTGFSDRFEPNWLPKERAWNFLQAYAKLSPIILQSQSTAQILQANHAFWARAVEENDKRR